MSGARDIAFIVGFALLPLCSIQHFIWPLSWCLLADISNHSWIPECGYDELLDSYRIFIDECDMFEYNCDHETDYEAVKYSDCFKQQMCPVAKIPCPSRPTCPDHRYHRAGDRYVYLTTARRNARRNMRRDGLRKEQLKQSLPPKMLKGRRRYTPNGRRNQSTKKMMLKTIVIFKRRKITRKMQARNTNTKSTTTKAPTRTSTNAPTRTIIRAASRTRTRSISLKPTLTTLFAQETARKPVTPSATPDLVKLTLTVQEPTRTMLSTAGPINFRTVILNKFTLWRFGRKMLRVVKGRVE